MTRLQNWVINLALFSPAVSLGIWYPHVGEVGAILAAFSAMLVIYFLPLMTYLRMKRMYHEQLVQAASEYTTSSNDDEINELSSSREDYENNSRPNNYRILLIGCTLLMIYGVFAFVVQLYYMYDQSNRKETTQLPIDL